MEKLNETAIRASCVYWIAFLPNGATAKNSIILHTIPAFAPFEHSVPITYLFCF